MQKKKNKKNNNNNKKTVFSDFKEKMYSETLNVQM